MIQNGMILDGRYQIIQEIGQGGTGVIYLAYHLGLHKHVVVKRIKDHFVGQVNGRAEVDILKNLHHRYLPQVYDFLVVENSIYTVMDYIEGKDLQYYLDQKYRFSEELVRRWLLELAEVLEYLHAQSPPILHSDIKPGNIMITANWDICLIDFNISLDGETSKEVQGISRWYAAPEQYESAMAKVYGQTTNIVLDGRMDIYSLGATFFRLMTGQLPTPTENQSEILQSLEVDYSDALKAIVTKMIQPQPSRRYASAEKLRKALENVEKQDPVYRKLGWMQMGVAIAWALCVIAGGLCIYYGSWKNSIEQWQTAYHDLYVTYESGADTQVVADGTHLLNDVSNRAYLEREPEKKADVLNIIGNSYYHLEQYTEAQKYYKEAWKLDAEQPEYYESYVAALISDAQYEQAEAAIESTDGRKALTDAKRNLLLLESAWLSGESGNADDLIVMADEMAAGGEQRTALNAYVLYAQHKIELEAYADALAALEKASTISSENDVLRMVGETAYKASDQCGDDASSKAEYLRKALDCYKILAAKRDATYEDRLNLALTQRSLGKYEDSIRTLQDMLPDFPDSYIPEMWICYDYLDLSQEKDNLEDIVDGLKFRYQDCKRSYDLSGESNPDMETLISIMDLF